MRTWGELLAFISPHITNASVINPPERPDSHLALAITKSAEEEVSQHTSFYESRLSTPLEHRASPMIAPQVEAPLANRGVPGRTRAPACSMLRTAAPASRLRKRRALDPGATGGLRRLAAIRQALLQAEGGTGNRITGLSSRPTSGSEQDWALGTQVQRYPPFMQEYPIDSLDSKGGPG